MTYLPFKEEVKQQKTFEQILKDKPKTLSYKPTPFKFHIMDESPNFISFETAIYAIVIFGPLVALLILCK